MNLNRGHNEDVKTTAESIRFTVATLNVRRHEWAEKLYGSWEDALTALVIWNTLQNPDIFCVQQLPADLFKRFASHLSMRKAGEARSRLEGLEDGCLVLWNPLHFGLKERQAFWFSESPTMPGSRLFSKFEPRGGQVVALQNDLISLRVVSCHWEPIQWSGEAEVMSEEARIRAASLIRNLLDSGSKDEPELNRFSEKTRGMPSLITGGFEGLPGARCGRQLLEESSFNPVSKLEFSRDEIYASPGIRLVEVLDSGGPNGQRPLMAELEIKLNQDDGVEAAGAPLPTDEERHSWPEVPGWDRVEAGTPERSQSGIK